MDKCLEAIRRGEDVRAGLIELKLRCKEDPKAAWALRAEDGVPEIFEQLLMHEDAKVRKNAALLLGEPMAFANVLGACLILGGAIWSELGDRFRVQEEGLVTA